MSHSADPDFGPSEATSIESSEEGGEDARLEDWQAEESEDFSEDAAQDAEALARTLSNDMVLKPDHHNRPLWVCRDGRIFVETSSPFYDKAYDFLTTVAEPVSRPECIHEYRLTPQSLYTAVSVGLDPQTILRVLGMLSKGKELDHAVVELVQRCTASHGSAKLVLKQGRFWVQTADEQVLDKLLAHPVIRAAQVVATPGGDARGVVCRAAVQEHEAAHLVNLTEQAAASGAGGGGPGQDGTAYQGVQEDAGRTVMAFEIHPSQVANVKRVCMPGQAGLDCPLLEEYDFAHDTLNQTLDIELGRDVCLRPHQQKSLRKLFGNGRARSGVIVLPCGAGKTLVGVAAAARVKKATLVLCNSSVSVDQWVQQFNLWTELDPNQVVKFGSNDKDDERVANLERLQKPCVCVTTFSMIAYKGEWSAYSAQMMQLLSSCEWGLLVLDEVHEVPANTFSKAIGDVKAHCKLGLTATPVREDDKIEDLSFLIGPKLYEADWMDLTRCGYIARVDCYEMRCPMTSGFYEQYRQNSQHNGLRQLLSVMNPNKFVACQHLINHHELHSDKVIVFCDNLWALEHYAKDLGKPYICGSTSDEERFLCLDNFKAAPAGATLFLSKVGDTSLDIPEANVLIQISGHGGSRRQEAQRLGRILRAKKGQQESHAIFYTLVSEGTKEMQYSGKRQQFLVNQGFTYKVVPHTAAAGQPKEPEEAQEAQGAQAPYPQPQAQQLQPQPQLGLGLKYSTAEEQQQLLQKVLDSVANRSRGGRNGAERGAAEGGDSSQPPAKMRRQVSAADAEMRARERRMRRDLLGSKH